MLGTCCQAVPESHPGYEHRYVVVVDEFCVGEGLCLDAEEAEQNAVELLHLAYEFIVVFERGEGVGVGAGKEFHASRIGQLLELVDEFRHVKLQLFDGCPRDADGAFERAVAFAYHFKQGIGHRHITLLCETGDDVVVCEIIIIVVVVAYVEKAVTFQTERLMDIEIETNRFHCSDNFFEWLLFEWLLSLKMFIFFAASVVSGGYPSPDDICR